MIKAGFDDDCSRIDKVDTKADKGMGRVYERLGGVDTRLEKIDQDPEDIKLRLGNTAFQFDVNGLKKRVKK